LIKQDFYYCSISSEPYHSFKIFKLLKTKGVQIFHIEASSLCRNHFTVPRKEDTLLLDAQVAGIHSTQINNLDKPENSFSFFLQNFRITVELV